jgi:tetratricopeptide (TPR) repeat protein
MPCKELSFDFDEMVEQRPLADAEQSSTPNPQEIERQLRDTVSADPSRADAWYTLGLIAMDTDRGESAVEYFRRAVGLNDHHAGYHNVLGIALAKMGQFQEAIECYGRALKIEPEVTDAHYYWGNALRAQNRLEEAVLEYRAALPRMDASHLAFYNLANALRDLGRHEEAIPNYREAIRVEPAFVKAYTNLGNVCKDLGRLGEAEAVHREAIRLKPDYAQAYHNLAIVLELQGRLAEAEANYRLTISIMPEFQDARIALARVLMNLDKLDEAVATLQSAEESPKCLDAWIKVADKLRTQRRYGEAIVHIQRVLQKSPSAEAYNSLALVFSSQGRLSEAARSFRQALSLKPDYAEAHSNLGVALECQGDYAEGMREFNLALAIRPNFAHAQMNRALSLLRRGELERGWQEYEWRWACDDRKNKSPSSPLWLGQPMPNQTILLLAEQGLGDTLQFIRYAAMVKQCCGRVVLQSQKPLLSLIAQCPGVDVFVAHDEPLPEHDCHLPLMSLPRVFDTTLAAIPAVVPYLFADDSLVAAWRERLADLNGFRVGIAWQGNPDYSCDIYRSAPLRYFAPLANVPGARLLSLQKGKGADQLRDVAADLRILSLSPEADVAAGPFMDTAAIMKNLDLVISTDTAIVHLAGAMGIPVWVALAAVNDWRWLETREDSPWYPTMRLFRQETWGDWETVFARIAAELKAVIEGDRSRLLAGRPAGGTPWRSETPPGGRSA